MSEYLNELGLLLALATAVAIICERLRLPLSVGLVIAGLGLTASRVSISLPLSSDLLYTFLLPPLVFEAGLRIRWKPLRKDLPVIVTLAGPGLVLAAAVVAWGMHWLVGWSLTAAALFGVLIAATDPVAVIATFDKADVRGRVDLLVRAESLANDGTAAVAFGILLAIFAGASTAPLDVVASLVRAIGGGILCGAGLAGALLVVAVRTRNHLVEISLTTFAAWGAFILAEHFHASGVLASLTAGLVVGNAGRLGFISETGQDAVTAFWEYAAFLTNSLIFILIGVRQAGIDFTAIAWPAIAAILVVGTSRAISVYGICGLFARSSHAVSRAHQHVLFWGGLRGALALALALGLPPSLAERDTIIGVTFAVVAFSVFVQTMTMNPLLRRLGITEQEAPLRSPAGDT